MSRYDIEKFDPPPDPDLVCCICQCVLDKAVESPCRHVFCQVCIERWLTNRHTCPTCRKRTRKQDLKPVLPLVQNMLNRLLMICDFRDNGCFEKIMLEQYERHILECGFEMKTCRFIKCGQPVLKMYLEEHERDQCEHRESACGGECGLMIALSDRPTHNCVTALKCHIDEKNRMIETLKTKLQELNNLSQSLNDQLEHLRQQLDENRPRLLSISSFSSSDGDDTDDFMSDDLSQESFFDENSNPSNAEQSNDAFAEARNGNADNEGRENEGNDVVEQVERTVVSSLFDLSSRLERVRNQMRAVLDARFVNHNNLTDNISIPSAALDAIVSNSNNNQANQNTQVAPEPANTSTVTPSTSNVSGAANNSGREGFFSAMNNLISNLDRIMHRSETDGQNSASNEQQVRNEGSDNQTVNDEETRSSYVTDESAAEDVERNSNQSYPPSNRSVHSDTSALNWLLDNDSQNESNAADNQSEPPDEAGPSTSTPQHVQTSEHVILSQPPESPSDSESSFSSSSIPTMSSVNNSPFREDSPEPFQRETSESPSRSDRQDSSWKRADKPVSSASHHDSTFDSDYRNIHFSQSLRRSVSDESIASSHVSEHPSDASEASEGNIDNVNSDSEGSANSSRQSIQEISDEEHSRNVGQSFVGHSDEDSNYASGSLQSPGNDNKSENGGVSSHEASDNENSCDSQDRSMIDSCGERNTPYSPGRSVSDIYSENESSCHSVAESNRSLVAMSDVNEDLEDHHRKKTDNSAWEKSMNLSQIDNKRNMKENENENGSNVDSDVDSIPDSDHSGDHRANVTEKLDDSSDHERDWSNTTADQSHDENSNGWSECEYESSDDHNGSHWSSASVTPDNSHNLSSSSGPVQRQASDCEIVDNSDNAAKLNPDNVGSSSTKVAQCEPDSTENLDVARTPEASSSQDISNSNVQYISLSDSSEDSEESHIKYLTKRLKHKDTSSSEVHSDRACKVKVENPVKVNKSPVRSYSNTDSASNKNAHKPISVRKRKHEKPNESPYGKNKRNRTNTISYHSKASSSRPSYSPQPHIDINQGRRVRSTAVQSSTAPPAESNAQSLNVKIDLSLINYSGQLMTQTSTATTPSASATVVHSSTNISPIHHSSSSNKQGSSSSKYYRSNTAHKGGTGRQTEPVASEVVRRQSRRLRDCRSSNRNVNIVSSPGRVPNNVSMSNRDFPNSWCDEEDDSESDNTWEPGSDVNESDVTVTEEEDEESDASYEVQVPKSAANLLEEYASEDTDESWTVGME